MILYQVKDWETHYEGAKTKSYKHQTRCIIPNKQNGLGYKRLLNHKNGESNYGAFIAICLLLSRQSGDRKGYLTDNGLPDGIPYTAEDISLVTGFKSNTIQEMLERCSDVSVGWLVAYDVKDTTGIPQGYCKDTTVSPLPQHLTLTSTLTSTSTNNLDTQPKFTISDIDKIYNSYPRKIAPAKAKVAIKKALQNIKQDNPVEWLLNKTIKYAKARSGKDNQFTPHPATWYNGERYNDDMSEWGCKTTTIRKEEFAICVNCKNFEYKCECGNKKVFKDVIPISIPDNLKIDVLMDKYNKTI